MLRQENIDVSGHKPRIVTKDELAHALRIISMGCTAEELGVPAERVEQWMDVPMVSQNILCARDAVQTHVQSLIAQLRDV